MPPVRNGRASKACEICRKQKTRCFDSSSPAGICLRCQTLGLTCSLQVSNPATENGESSAVGSVQMSSPSQSIDARFDRLEKVVNTLVDRLDLHQRQQLPEASPVSRSHLQQSQSPSTPFSPSLAPVLTIRDVAKEIEPQGQAPTELTSRQDADIITKGLILYDDACTLLSLFVKHYGRWVDMHEGDVPGTTLSVARRSPLLLCACCLVGIRHVPQEDSTTLSSRLFDEAKQLLSTTLLDVPQSREFFQAVVLLSLWSTTIGQVPLSMDGWLLTGFALNHTKAIKAFDQFADGSPEDSHVRATIWNHLCLAHLHYCIGTQRKAVICAADVRKCRLILEMQRPNNFELRMVAEINLYWQLYEDSVQGKFHLRDALAHLEAWKKEWSFLFDQPRAQFLEMGLHFAKLILHETSLKSKSFSESCLSEMVRASSSIVRLAMSHGDERTRHLTDHVYHMITFAAITICRLLHMYEIQFAAQTDVLELDSLIIQLARWLQTIGYSCHVAHKLGHVVLAFHRKLRPNTQPDSLSDADFVQESPGDPIFLFPEILGMDVFGTVGETLLPDWGPVPAEYTPTDI